MQTEKYDDRIRSGVWKLLEREKWICHREAGSDSGNFSRWTELGKCRTLQLRQLIDTFNLSDGAAEPFRFTEACRKVAGQPPTTINDTSRQFWIECLDGLGIPNEQEAIREFICLISDEELEPCK